MPSTPLPLLPEGPSHLPPVLPLAALLCPQGPTRPGGGFGGQGIGLGAQQAAWGPSGWGSRPLLLSCPSWMAPPACHSSSPQLPSYAPRTHMAWLGLWRRGTGLRAQQAPRPKWARRSPSAPLLLFPESPSRLPLLISLPGLRGANPVWPPLLLPPQSPYFLPVHFGVPAISLGVSVPHQRLAGTLVVGRS